MTDKKHSSICSCDRSARSEDLTQLKLWSISMVPSRPQTRRNNETIFARGDGIRLGLGAGV